MRKLLVALVFTGLAFSLVACSTAKPVLIVDEPLRIGRQAEPQGRQFASLWNPSRAEALEARSSGGAGAAFNPAAPGPIGATTSNTIQLTQGCVGVSPCTLPGTTGQFLFGAAPLQLSGGASLFASGIWGINADTADNRMEFDVPTGKEFDWFIGPSTQNAKLTNSGFSQVGGVSFFVGAGGAIQSSGGAIPTITCSGGATGTSVAAGSTNNRGQVVTSSSASTNCTLTWSAAGTWNQAPFCVVVDGSASITPTVFSVGATGTSTMVFDFASATSKTVNYLCM